MSTLQHPSPRKPLSSISTNRLTCNSSSSSSTSGSPFSKKAFTPTHKQRASLEVSRDGRASIVNLFKDSNPIDSYAASSKQESIRLHAATAANNSLARCHPTTTTTTTTHALKRRLRSATTSVCRATEREKSATPRPPHPPPLFSSTSTSSNDVAAGLGRSPAGSSSDSSYTTTATPRQTKRSSDFTAVRPHSTSQVDFDDIDSLMRQYTLMGEDEPALAHHRSPSQTPSNTNANALHSRSLSHDARYELAYSSYNPSALYPLNAEPNLALHALSAPAMERTTSGATIKAQSSCPTTSLPQYQFGQTMVQQPTPFTFVPTIYDPSAHPSFPYDTSTTSYSSLSLSQPPSLSSSISSSYSHSNSCNNPGYNATFDTSVDSVEEVSHAVQKYNSSEGATGPEKLLQDIIRDLETLLPFATSSEPASLDDLRTAVDQLIGKVTSSSRKRASAEGRDEGRVSEGSTATFLPDPSAAKDGMDVDVDSITKPATKPLIFIYEDGRGNELQLDRM